MPDNETLWQPPYQIGEFQDILTKERLFWQTAPLLQEATPVHAPSAKQMKVFREVGKRWDAEEENNG